MQTSNEFAPHFGPFGGLFYALFASVKFFTFVISDVYTTDGYLLQCRWGV